jgi:hypothetical protein
MRRKEVDFFNYVGSSNGLSPYIISNSVEQHRKALCQSLKKYEQRTREKFKKLSATQLRESEIELEFHLCGQFAVSGSSKGSSVQVELRNAFEIVFFGTPSVHHYIGYRTDRFAKNSNILFNK